ncbi:MAG: 50S ribosomal protein L23, partial [Candidatus Moraniibacteriota bacterium]
MNTVLIKPHFTEKSLKATSNSGFTFQVDQFATKSQIKEVIEATFAVKVVRISTRLSHVPGKRSATRRSTSR